MQDRGVATIKTPNGPIMAPRSQQVPTTPEDKENLLYSLDNLLSVLLVSPKNFASIINEVNLGRYFYLQAAQVMTPSQVLTVQIPNPADFHLLLLSIQADFSSPIVDLQVVKDSIIIFERQGVSTINNDIPNVFTPALNSAYLQFTNQSGLSSPNISYYFDFLQIRVDIWDRLYYAMRRILGDLSRPTSPSEML